MEVSGELRGGRVAGRDPFTDQLFCADLNKLAPFCVPNDTQGSLALCPGESARTEIRSEVPGLQHHK